MINNKELLKTLTFLLDINKKFKESKLRIISSNRIHHNKFNYFRYIVSNSKFRELYYCDILINYFKKAESFYPGSSFYLSEYIVNKMLRKRNTFENTVKAKKSIENINEYFLNNATSKNFDLIKNVLKFSGPNATISCTASDTNEIIVKKNKNPIFNVSIHKDFAPIYFSKSKAKTQTYLISVMDAYIERESEIVPLIDNAKTNKIPLLLFCRGISENATRAIKNIILRNNVHILPYIISFDNNDPFKLEDISEVLGCTIVSANTGDSIYKDSLKKTTTTVVKAFWDKIEILKPNSYELNKKINEKIKSCSDSNLKEYLFKRKSRINTNVIEVLIPRASIEMLTELKCLIVSYNLIAAFGLRKVNKEIIPERCINTAEILGKKLIETLSSIGYIVLQNRSEQK